MDTELPKSKFTYGNRKLHELSHAELLEATEALWNTKNEEIAKIKAERDGLRQLLSSPLPIHNLWRGFADNAVLLSWVIILAFLIGKSA